MRSDGARTMLSALLLVAAACGGDAGADATTPASAGAGGAAGASAGSAGASAGKGGASAGAAGTTAGTGGASAGAAGTTAGTGGASAGAAGTTAGTGGASAGSGGASAGSGGAGAGSGGAAAGAGTGGVGPCPTFADGVSAGKVESNALTEVSGIAASRRNPGVLWVHNDSGGGVAVYAIDATGKHLGAFTVVGPTGGDVEDIAVGPGPDPAKTYVYLGDIGDNAVARTSVRIFRLEEPSVSLAGPATTADVTADQLTLTYPDGPHNAEALMVDPISRDGFIVTKNGGLAKIFRFAAAAFVGGTNAVPEMVGTVDAGVVSSADFSPDGSLVIIKNDQTGKLWRRPAGGSLLDALATTPCPIKTKVEPNGEAMGWAADGSGYYTTSEELHQPIWFFKMTP